MPQHCIETILAEYKEWGLSGRPHFIGELSGGLTNKSYLIECGKQKLVIRVFAENSEQLNINRHAEFIIARLAAGHGLAAQPIYLSPDYIYSISQYVDGDIICNSPLHGDEKPELVAEMLKQLHALVIEVELPVLDIVEKAANYWRAIEQLSGVGDCLQYQSRLQAFFENLPKPQTLALCHNDLVAENMILGPTGLRLIDWEYAALGNAHFDIASIFINQSLSKEQQQRFLKALW